MKQKYLVIVLLCLAVLVVHSCVEENLLEQQENEQQEPDPQIPEEPELPVDNELEPNEQAVDYDNVVFITYTTTDAEINNPFEGDGVTIDNDNGHVVITSERTDLELNYVLSGITDNGSLKIYGQKEIGLVLNGVGITNPNGAAINIQNKKKCTIHVEDSTNNRLIDGEAYTPVEGEDMKASLFCEGELEITGKGNLEIRGKYKHAICSDSSLKISGGIIQIKEAAGDGIHVNDGIDILAGEITIRSNSDGMESESDTHPINIMGGTISIITTGQKSHAIKSKHNINIDTDNAIEITTYGSASKGIKPTGDITIVKGELTINTAGDAIWDADEKDISSAAGIKCDGNFLMQSGSLTMLTTGKGGKGINSDGTLTIDGGTISVTTTGEQYVYDRTNDTAAKAIKSDGNLTINGGNIKVHTSKTEAEGIESKTTITITDGTIEVVAYDDAINASKHLQIEGGNIYCYSTTNDAIDSNGTITISGGVIVAAGATQPEAGFDCDNNRFAITGGIVLGFGGSTSSPTANYCTQRSLVFNSLAANTQIVHIETGSGGKEILTFRLPRVYSTQATMLFSSPQIEANTGYTIYTGGSITEGSDTFGVYTDASYTKGTAAGTFTAGSANGAVTTVGTSGGPGGNPGGGPGGRW